MKIEDVLMNIELLVGDDPSDLLLSELIDVGLKSTQDNIYSNMLDVVLNK